MLAAAITATVTSCASEHVADDATSTTAAAVSTSAHSTATSASPGGSTGDARACTAGDLGTHFHGGRHGTGFVAGSVLIYNRGDVPCQLTGPVGFAALFHDGSTGPRPTNAPLPLDVVLPARMTRPGEETGFDDYLAVSIAGFDRDDPGQPEGLCRPQDESTPESFVRALGSITLQVPNSDPRRSPPTTPLRPSSAATATCSSKR